MSGKARGFTLIELLVVIAIIAILAAILFPVFAAAKQKANQTKCLNNMTQIGKAILLYAEDHRGCFPRVWPNNWAHWGGGSGTSGPATIDGKDPTWRERTAKYTKNRAVFVCPVKTKIPSYPLYDWYIGHYGFSVFLATNDLTAWNDRISSSAIPQPSKTIMVCENRDGDWSGEPFHNTSGGSNTGVEGMFHPYHGDTNSQDPAQKGGVFLFCDCHARFLFVPQNEANNFWLWRVRK